MEDTVHELIVVGGGIAGSAAALRAAQYHLDTAWVLGSAQTARASRGKYVYDVDNMIGVHDGLVRQQVLGLLHGPQHEPARALLESAHLHIGTEDIIRNVQERIQQEFPSFVELVDGKAVQAARDASGAFVVTLEEGGRTVRGRSLVLATGCMDRQPSIALTTRSGKTLDDIHWVYPYANHETLLYCIRCEGHLTRDTSTAVLGASDTTAQVALMLRERYGTRVTILTNGEPFQATETHRRLLEAHGIGVRTERITGFLDAPGKPKGRHLRGFQLQDGSTVEAVFGLVAMGLYRVYNDLARQLGAELEPDAAPEIQHVLVEDRTSETSVRGLFAIGDMSKVRGGTAPSMKQIYTAQEYAVRAVDTLDARRRKALRQELLAKSVQ